MDKNMEKDNITFQIIVSMMEILKMINLMVKDFYLFHKENIKDNFHKANFMAKVYLDGKMVHSIKEIIKMIGKTDMENMQTNKENHIKVCGKKDIEVEKELSHPKMVRS